MNVLNLQTTSIEKIWLGIITFVGIGLFFVRLAGPFDLADGYHQERQACYIQDILQNGHWICQRDVNGEIASKPPMHAWVAASFSLLSGQPNRVTLLLPGALATIGLAWMIFFHGSRYFSARAGGFGALAYLLSAIGAKQIALVRIDGLFAFMVVWTAFETFRAWERGTGWTRPWLAASAATLTKGPLALLLASFGLLAAWWERRNSPPHPLRGSHVTGIALFLLINLGWFSLAYSQMGWPLVEKMIFSELFRHAVSSSAGAFPGSGFYGPMAYFFARFAPWSLFALLGLYQVWKHPSAESTTRRFERFVFCYIVGCILLFSVVAHQRPDLLFPVFPFAALLAGRELDRLAGSKAPRRVLVGSTAVVALAFLAIGFSYVVRKSQHEAVLRTKALKGLAEEIQSEVGANFPLTYVDSYYTLQFYLNTMRPRTSLDRATQLLKGSPAVFVAVRDLKRLKAAAAKSGANFFVLKTREVKGITIATVVSNHPRLEWTPSMVNAVGPITIITDQARVLKVRDLHFSFVSTAPRGRVTFRNLDDEPQTIRAAFACPGEMKQAAKELAPRASWTVECGGVE